MELQSIKDRIPDYAKDLRLNLDAVLNRSSLTPVQANGAALAAAFAAKSAPLIAALREGDMLTLDVPSRRIAVDLTDQELQARMQQWQPPAPRYTHGVMAKYARLVSSASEGACTG